MPGPPSTFCTNARSMGQYPRTRRPSFRKAPAVSTPLRSAGLGFRCSRSIISRNRLVVWVSWDARSAASRFVAAADLQPGREAMSFGGECQGHGFGPLHAAREHARAGGKAVAGFQHGSGNGEPNRRGGNLRVRSETAFCRRRAARFVGAHRQRHQVRAQGERTRCAAPECCRSCGKTRWRNCRAGFHVRAQALPIEAPLEQQEPSGGGKRD